MAAGPEGLVAAAVDAICMCLGLSTSRAAGRLGGCVGILSVWRCLYLLEVLRLESLGFLLRPEVQRYEIYQSPLWSIDE